MICLHIPLCYDYEIASPEFELMRYPVYFFGEFMDRIAENIWAICYPLHVAWYSLNMKWLNRFHFGVTFKGLIWNGHRLNG